jgi:hypothetical protein
MSQNRKQDMPNRQSSTESEGRRRERSVMDDEETFEHGSGGSEVSRGMGSGDRGKREKSRQDSSDVSNRARDRDRDDERPERGRSDSER